MWATFEVVLFDKSQNIKILSQSLWVKATFGIGLWGGVVFCEAGRSLAEGVEAIVPFPGRLRGKIKP